MSDKSKSTQLINAAAQKGDANAKAILAIYEIADSMKETASGDSKRSRMLKTAADLRANGNEQLAVALEKEAQKLPESKRGVTWEEAMKRAAQHLAQLGFDANDVFKNGLTKVCGAKAYQLYFEKPEKTKKDKPATPAQPR